MKNLGHEATRDLMLLSIAAGSADAAGFIGIGHVFTSNMTGNLVLLGIACGQGQWLDAARTLFVVALFVIGAALGARMAWYFPDSFWRKLMMRLLLVELVLLLAFAINWAFVPPAGHAAQFFFMAPALAVAMGLQSAAMNRLTIAGVTSTAMTGTLTNFAAGLEGVFFRYASVESSARNRMKKQLLVILFYCGGAAIQGILIRRADWAMGFFPALCVLLIVLAHRKD